MRRKCTHEYFLTIYEGPKGLTSMKEPHSLLTMLNADNAFTLPFDQFDPKEKKSPLIQM